ncbi:MAG: 50S ribosomal protein L6 [Puniceicoccales bacterium]|jgi:large subunit ribosomal protein L6|nr:50S ribosomal protein L6 [Puniceicoccales bacterium]
MMATRAERSALPVPAGVEVLVQRERVAVKGPYGRLEKSFPTQAVRVICSENGRSISFQAVDGSRRVRALVGTVRSIVAGMLQGAATGFFKDLEIAGVGFKASFMDDRTLNLALGTSHPVHYVLPEGIRVKIVDGIRLHVEGVDKQMVGQVAADIFSFYPMEPYKGKGVRIVGRFVRRKEGKKTA